MVLTLNSDDIDRKRKPDFSSESKILECEQSEREEEYEDDTWELLTVEASGRNLSEYNELAKGFTVDSLEEEETKLKSYWVMLP